MKITTRRLAAALLALLPTTLRAASPLDGIWLSQGYNFLLQIDGDSLTSSDLTSISCGDPTHLTRAASPDFPGDFVFEQDGTVVRIHLTDPNTARLIPDSAAAAITLRRAKALPATYGHTPPNDPPTNYAIFYQCFADNYPFFDLHHVDWPALDRQYRPKVTASTTPAELFDIMRAMIEPLHDAHVSLHAPDIKKAFGVCRLDTPALTADELKRPAEIIATKYARSGLRHFCNDKLTFTTLDHSVGYLALTGLSGYDKSPLYSTQAEVMASALDVIFTNPNFTALVIDDRLNPGGYDVLGSLLASRLTDRPYLAYTKSARDNLTGPVHFTPPEPHHISPSTRPSFHGPVALLTSANSCSGAETFAMALMGRTPAVTRIGEPTQGVFSDVQYRHLPNGWVVCFSNEIYWTPDHKSFESTGVPPDISVPTFTPDDLKNARDPALEKALELLHRK